MEAVFKSLERARRRGLGKRFYELLMLSSDEIRGMFENTDFERQQELFEHGLQMLLKYAAGEPIGRMAIERLGRLHDAEHLGVRPSLYLAWAQCLLLALRELDPAFDDALEDAWIEAITPGIEAMSMLH